MRTQVDCRRVAWRGLCLWAALWMPVLYQFPSAWQRCQPLFHQVQEVMQAAASPQLVIITPAVVAVRTAVQRDGLKTSAAVAGFDAQGCLRYAGSSEALSSASAPLQVYLRPLPLSDCIGSDIP